MKTLWRKNRENPIDRISHAWAPLNMQWIRLLICRLQLQMCRRLLGLKQGLLHSLHRQSKLPTTRLHFIQAWRATKRLMVYGTFFGAYFILLSDFSRFGEIKKIHTQKKWKTKAHRVIFCVINYFNSFEYFCLIEIPMVFIASERSQALHNQSMRRKRENCNL